MVGGETITETVYIFPTIKASSGQIQLVRYLDI